MLHFYELQFNVCGPYYEAAAEPFPEDLGDLVLGPDPPPAPVRFEIVRGSRPADIIGCAVWSERLISVLRECGATGFKPYEIELYRKGKPVPGYMGVLVLGRGGPLDEVRSDVERDETGKCIFGHSAVYMHEDQWDGSDVFVIPGLGIREFVTARVAEVLRKARLRNVQLILNSECRFGTKDPPPTPPPGQ